VIENARRRRDERTLKPRDQGLSHGRTAEKVGCNPMIVKAVLRPDYAPG
jgi:hypothetical protein